MAPLPIISDTYRCVLHWKENGGQSAVNVMHIRRLAGTASAVATQLDTAVTAGMWTLLVSTAKVDTLFITPLDGVSSTFILPVSGAKWTGVQTGDFVPQMAALVKLSTGTRGRFARGRLFLPFAAEGPQFAGQFASANVATAQSAWSTFLSAMSAASYPVVVASYKLQSRFDVVTATVETFSGSQRRRQQRNRV